MKTKNLELAAQINPTILPTIAKADLIKVVVVNFILLSCLIAAPIYAAPRGVLFDYFGTGRSDYVLLGEENGRQYWDILRNPVTNPPQTRRVFWGFPYPTDLALLGDYDGDMKNDIGVWRPGNQSAPPSYFYIQRSTNPNPNAIFSQQFGLPDDYPPQAGDFDGDGRDDLTVVRQESGAFSHYILPSGGGGFRRVVFGAASDYQVTTGANFAGDSRDEIVVYRVNQNTGELTAFGGDSVTGAVVFAQPWGTETGFEAAIFGYGDYLGDARADLVHVYGRCGGCANEGTWWIKETGGAGAVRVFKFGVPLDQNFEGDFPNFDSDFDGDGKLDVSVFRPQNSTFYTLRSSDGGLTAQRWDGDSTAPRTEDGEYFDAPAGKTSRKIPLGALNSVVVSRSDDGTYRARRGFDYYLKK